MDFIFSMIKINYVFSFVAGIVTILIGKWLSSVLLLLFAFIYEPVIKSRYPQQENKIEKVRLFFTRIANGLTVGLLNSILIYALSLSPLIPLAVFLIFITRFSEPFNGYIYYEICNSDEVEYKTFLSKLKRAHFISYMITNLPGIVIGL